MKRGTFSEVAKLFTKEELEKLQSMKDEDIDLSDIPEITNDYWWDHAERGKFYIHKKRCKEDL